MIFKTASQIQTVIQEFWRAEQIRARNRAKINRLFNGEAPYTQNEVTENKIGTNVNFLEAANIAHGARGMFNRAFTDLKTYFDIKVTWGPVHLRQQWGMAITKTINKALHDSFEYSALQEQKFAQVVLHGPATPVWPGRHSILPEFVGIGKMMFPSRTNRDMTNLECFAIHREWNKSQLAKMSSGPNQKGWDMQLVKALIAQKDREPLEMANIDDWRFPETLAEDAIANAGMYACDAVPKVRAWDFFFLNDKDEEKPVWNRRIVLDNDTSGTQTTQSDRFLYDAGDTSFGEDWRRIFSLQYADGNNVAPFWYHAERSLGKMLYASAHLANRLRCRMVDVTFREAMMLFRNVGDGDRERLGLIEMQDLGVIPEGLNIVSASERYQVNDRLFQMAQQQMRQLMGENSAHFTNDISDGNNQKDKTATQIIAEQQASNSLVGAMLGMALRLEEFQDREICRRFCDKENKHRWARAFRDLMLLQGIPEKALNVDLWEISRTRQIGNGNKTIQMAIVDRLMAIYQYLAPGPQQHLLRIYSDASSDDQGVGELLVPLDNQNKVSPTKETASLAWGSLIDNKPVFLEESTNRVEWCDVMISFLGAEIQTIEQTGETPDMRRIIGIQNVVTQVSQVVASMAGDPTQKERVQAYSAALAEVMGKVQEYAKVAQEQAQATGQTQMDPKDQAKVQAIMLTAETKAQIKERDAAQKRAHSEEKFQREMEQQQMRVGAEVASQDARTAADIQRENVKAALEPKKSSS